MRLEKNLPRAEILFLLPKVSSGDDLCSRAVARQVLSAQRSLTTVFGMGTGVTFSL